MKCPSCRGRGDVPSLRVAVTNALGAFRLDDVGGDEDLFRKLVQVVGRLKVRGKKTTEGDEKGGG